MGMSQKAVPTTASASSYWRCVASKRCFFIFFHHLRNVKPSSPIAHKVAAAPASLRKGSVPSLRFDPVSFWPQKKSNSMCKMWQYDCSVPSELCPNKSRRCSPESRRATLLPFALPLPTCRKLSFLIVCLLLYIFNSRSRKQYGAGKKSVVYFKGGYDSNGHKEMRNPVVWAESVWRAVNRTLNYMH